MTEPSKIFYSCFSRSETTGKHELIYSTYADQGFFVYDIDTKAKKHILTCYFVLVVERIPGTNDYFVVGNDKPNYIRVIKEKDGYEVKI